MIVELPPLLSEADLHIAQLTLLLLTSIARLQPQALSFVANTILPETLNLAKSPLLQGIILKPTIFLHKIVVQGFCLVSHLNYFVLGAALSSMLEFFQALVAANLPGLGYRDLLQLLMAPISVAVVSPTVAATPTLHKQVIDIFSF